MIDVYFWPTPNGRKITIMLEECGMPYKIVPVDIGGGDLGKEKFSKEEELRRRNLLFNQTNASVRAAREAALKG